MCAILEEDTVPHSEQEEKAIPQKGVGALKQFLREDQIKRVENGSVETYKNGLDYLVSPGFCTVSASSFKSFCKTSGFGELLWYSN